MTHLIDKDALVAEIENLVNTYKKCPTRNSYEEGLKEGRLIGYKDALHKINILEVKEVDLEDAKKEELAQKYVDYTFKRHNIDANSKEGQLIYYAYIHGMNQCLDKLKAQKGE